jgi:hypothetical protein
MAEMFNPQNPEILELNRQRKLADLLTSQGMQTPQGQTVAGGVYVPPNPMEYLSKLFSTYAGTKANEKLDAKEVALAKALREQGLNEVNDILTLSQGRQALPSQELAGPAYNGVAPSIQYPAIEANPQAAMAKALTAQSPQAQTLAAPLMQNLLPKKTEKLIEYDTYKKEGGTKSFSDWSREITPEQQARLDIDRQRLGLEGARLGLEKEKLAQELSGAKLTESQGNATGFGVRAKEANSLLSQLEKSGTKDTGVFRSTVAGTLGMTPFIGEKLEQSTHAAMNVLPSALGGPNQAQQATDQARRNFVTAVLRKESGASISPSEFYNESQKYFPQPGDSDSVIRQKQHARETAIKSLEVQAGPGANIIRQTPEPKLEIGGAKKVVNFNDLP